MDTTVARRIGAVVVVAALALIVGCGEITERDMADSGNGTGGMAGSIDHGSGGAMEPSGIGGSGVGGSPVVNPGTGGSVHPGTGGASPASYLSCGAYNWIPSGGGECLRQVSVGRWQHGSKDGRGCYECNTPSRPAGAPECTLAGGELCVLSCDECTFQ